MSIKNISQPDGFPNKFYIVVEIPKGSRNKYEYDEKLDIIKLDRVYTAAMSQPTDYGLIPGTRGEDGDNLDVLIILDHSVFPGCLVSARAIGLLKMIDSGDPDAKVIAVATDDIRYKHIDSLDQLSPHFKKEVEHYFNNYKALEGKEVKVTGWGDKQEALEILQKAKEKEEGK